MEEEEEEEVEFVPSIMYAEEEEEEEEEVEFFSLILSSKEANVDVFIAISGAEVAGGRTTAFVAVRTRIPGRFARLLNICKEIVQVLLRTRIPGRFARLEYLQGNCTGPD